MTNGNQQSIRRLSRFDWRLWNRFVAIAQPYWFPSTPGSGRIFFGLLLLLLLFLFSLAFVLVSAIVLLAQQYLPIFMEETAGGLVTTIQGIINSPYVLLVMAGLVIPAIGFARVRDQVLPRWRQWLLLSLLLLLLLSVSGLNVTISYVGNFFNTALAQRDEPTFWRFLYVYAGVFVVGTPIVVIYGYVRDLLGLFWRDWMTGKFLSQYFQNRSYYVIDSNNLLDNPDQRISEDIRSFTVTSLTFLLIILGAVIDVIAFSGILWSISRTLSFFLLGYAIFGTIVSALLGQRLITLNFNQLRREADFRYGLVHVRDNAESIAFYRGEAQEMNQVQRRFGAVLSNFNLLIGWQRNLGFFTTGYGYAVIILPSLIMAPLYFAGQIEFGDITQANFAFRQVLDAFSIVVLQIERLSAFAAGVNRLETFVEALEEQEESSTGERETIETIEAPRIEMEHVTLRTPKGQRTLVEDLTFALRPGDGMVIVGHSGAGKSSLLRAIAGLWDTGTGRITRPDLEDMLFLPQRPYMVLGSLRDQLLYPNTDASVENEQLERVLRQVNLANLPERVGGFEAELDWADVLSLGEQQRLAFARLILSKPRYAILDEATSALDLDNERRLYELISKTSTCFISVGHRPSLVQYHQYVLELTGDTQWRLLPVDEYQLDINAFS
jgi:putative ATP-binding cassette transporter